MLQVNKLSLGPLFAAFVSVLWALSATAVMAELGLGMYHGKYGKAMYATIALQCIAPAAIIYCCVSFLVYWARGFVPPVGMFRVTILAMTAAAYAWLMWSVQATHLSTNNSSLLKLLSDRGGEVATTKAIAGMVYQKLNGMAAAMKQLRASKVT